MIKLELSHEELQILVQALDTHVRQHGLQVAKSAAMILQRLQDSAKDPEPDQEK